MRVGHMHRKKKQQRKRKRQTKPLPPIDYSGFRYGAPQPGSPADLDIKYAREHGFISMREIYGDDFYK